MKMEKGQAGYIAAQKRKLGLQALLGFGLVLLILIVGYIVTKTRVSLFTVIAVLGCLPAAKVLVEFVAILPYKTIEKKVAEEIDTKAPLLTTAYDLVITSRDKIMPVDAIVISNHTVFGYAKNPKTNPEEVAKHIKNILAENRYSKTTVKVFSEYVPFISRVEGLNSIIEVNHAADKKLERAIRKIILNISM
ncbi:MAG: hypothetical protein Q4C52_07585 [Eubacteriales bacterium]|nr:hypothetical protein [Eubacteriales bacterium]